MGDYGHTADERKSAWDRLEAELRGSTAGGTGGLVTQEEFEELAGLMPDLSLSVIAKIMGVEIQSSLMEQLLAEVFVPHARTPRVASWYWSDDHDQGSRPQTCNKGV